MGEYANSVGQKEAGRIGRQMFRERGYRKCGEWIKSSRWMGVGEEELRGK